MRNLLEQFNLTWCNECNKACFISCLIAVILGIISAIVVMEITFAPRVGNELSTGTSILFAAFCAGITITFIYLILMYFKYKVLKKCVTGMQEHDTTGDSDLPELRLMQCNTMFNEECSVARYIRIISSRISSFVESVDQILETNESSSDIKSAIKRQTKIYHILTISSKFRTTIEKISAEMNARRNFIDSCKPSKMSILVLDKQLDNLKLIEDTYKLFEELHNKIEKAQSESVSPAA